MSGEPVALRLDDVGAASKRWEVYGATRVGLGRLRVPFPGNFLWLKYLPPVRRWGPYRELGAGDWERILAMLEAAGARMTVAVTAGWVERDARVVPFPRKFPDAARVLREGARRGLVEIANHGYTHCVLAGGAFRPRPLSGNRQFHREFLDSVPEDVQRHHLARAQAILGECFDAPVLTFVPPGNAFSPATLEAARAVGLRYLSCHDPRRHGARTALTAVDDGRVLALHDRDLVVGGLGALGAVLARGPLVTVREVAAAAEESAR